MIFFSNEPVYTEFIIIYQREYKSEAEMVAEQERKEKEEAARKKAEEEAARAAAARVASTNSSVEATSVTLVSQSTGKALGWMAPARNHELGERIMRKQFFKFGVEPGLAAVLHVHGPKEACALEAEDLFMISDCCRSTEDNPVIMINEVRGPYPRITVEGASHDGAWCFNEDGTIGLRHYGADPQQIVLGHSDTAKYSVCALYDMFAYRRLFKSRKTVLPPSQGL